MADTVEFENYPEGIATCNREDCGRTASKRIFYVKEDGSRQGTQSFYCYEHFEYAWSVHSRKKEPSAPKPTPSRSLTMNDVEFAMSGFGKVALDAAVRLLGSAGVEVKPRRTRMIVEMCEVDGMQDGSTRFDECGGEMRSIRNIRVLKPITKDDMVKALGAWGSQHAGLSLLSLEVALRNLGFEVEA